ncbi:leucyl aminopeptidase [Alteribacter natronophilus]|uniref:leucyl aminopeptidase n=1 Tax=Alteribacter natronophilus TaxID=2583810 RepID=UPI00110E4B1D|nr:leucyl aminopeptidase [Alteribacter natronophilus]TMW72510.1 leucyl aminopeptidase [Alteribacter natronophilus]
MNYSLINEEDSNPAAESVIVAGVFNDGEAVRPGVPEDLKEPLAKLAERHGRWHRKGQFHFVSLNDTDLIIAGLGEEDAWTERAAEETGAALQRFLMREHVTETRLYCSSFALNKSEGHLKSFARGMTLASYEVDTYKTGRKSGQSRPVELQAVYAGDPEKGERVFRSGVIQGTGTNEARRLINTPANYMTPTVLAEEAVRLAGEYEAEIEVFDEERIEAAGMHALMAVAKGSEEPPRFIVLKHRGRPDSDEWDTALVGKGLTYDSGGYSLKTRDGMKTMKMDMGGAAAVLGAMRIIFEEKPKVNVAAIIPSTENLINGKAMKPGDVIQSLGGKTIEVLNTDAEGRLILADGVAYANQIGAKSIIDTATLTGAVVVALGDTATGAVTNNEDLMSLVISAGDRSGERIWAFPNDKAYREKVRKSDVADLNNSPGRQAGSITAGLFIGEFAGDTPWVHLDIAGTGWQEGKTSLCPRGGTGSMARTLAEAVCRMEEK